LLVGGICKGGVTTPVVTRPLTLANGGILPYIDQVVPDFLEDSDFLDHVGTFDKLIHLPHDRAYNWGLPGHGDSLDNCGTFFWLGCLKTEDHPDTNQAYFDSLNFHRCFSPKCPICWLYWCRRASSRVTDRIKSYLSVHKKLKVIHVVASVPSESYFWSVTKLRRFAQKIVKKAGFWGGSCIFHPFRQVPESGLWYFSPHFHFIGVGWIKNTAKLYLETEWIIKNVKVRKTIFGTAFYQLTHAGVWYGERRRSTTTWFGVMSYNQMPLGPIPKRERKSCPYCGAYLVPLLWIGSGREPLPCGVGFLAGAENWFANHWSIRYPPGWKDLFGSLWLSPGNDKKIEVFL